MWRAGPPRAALPRSGRGGPAVRAGTWGGAGPPRAARPGSVPPGGRDRDRDLGRGGPPRIAGRRDGWRWPGALLALLLALSRLSRVLPAGVPPLCTPGLGGVARRSAGPGGRTGRPSFPGRRRRARALRPGAALPGFCVGLLQRRLHPVCGTRMAPRPGASAARSLRPRETPAPPPAGWRPDHRAVSRRSSAHRFRCPVRYSTFTKQSALGFVFQNVLSSGLPKIKATTHSLLMRH